MKNKTKASLLALTLLVSQQMNCGEEPKAPEAQANKSMLTWKNAGIAAAVAGTSAAAVAAYYYKDAIEEIINQLRGSGATKIDAAVVNAEIANVVEDKNAEVANELNDIALKQQEVATLQQLLSLPDDQQVAIIAELIKDASQDASAPMAEAAVMSDVMPTDNSALEPESVMPTDNSSLQPESVSLSETISIEEPADNSAQ